MNISNELFQIAGFFERYRKTGGTITAAEACDLSARLAMLAEGVGVTETAVRSIADEFDRYIEDQCNDRPGVVARPRSALAFADIGRGFAVIDGGLAAAAEA